MKKILLVFTGGTIGSQITNGVIDTSSGAGYTLLEMFAYQDMSAAQVQFSSISPLQILSENLHPCHWSQIISAIESKSLTEFDGIILTHGTDTLAFTAAALGLYFHDIGIPMVLVSSDLPLADPHANGLANFCCAVAFIQQVAKAGVYVAYQNRGQSMQLFLATRIVNCLQLSSDFMGVQSKAFMIFQHHKFMQLVSRDTIVRYPKKLLANFSTRILVIRPYPGLDYSQFKLDDVDVVLHDLYHSGTACTIAEWGQQHDLLAFILRCRQQQLDIYLAPAIKSESAYHSTQQLLAIGAKMIWNMSLEVAYAKLLLAYGNFGDNASIADFLEHNLAGELV